MIRTKELYIYYRCRWDPEDEPEFSGVDFELEQLQFGFLHTQRQQGQPGKVSDTTGFPLASFPEALSSDAKNT